MKFSRIIQTLIMVFLLNTAAAQQGINYKAIIHDDSGDPLANSPITVQFTILENGTSTVYQESHNPITDANGIINLNIGEGTPVNGDYSSIHWSNNPHFLKTEIDTGEGLTDMGTAEFKTVPYAKHSESANYAIDTDDADPDPANEIQQLSLNGNVLGISEGNTVDLSSIDVLEGTLFFGDKDADGFGDSFTALWLPQQFPPPAGYVENSSDCDDANENINPGALEVDDGIDNDCDGEIDEDFFSEVHLGEARYLDFGQVSVVACDYPPENLDALTYAAISPELFSHYGLCRVCIEVTGPEGTATFKILDQIGSCEQTDCGPMDIAFSYEGFDLIGDPSHGIIPVTWTIVPCQDDNDGDSWSEADGDCDDNDVTVYPGAEEICGDGIDQDCNGSDLSCPPVTDYDGNMYQTVQIGTQLWMAENLKTTHYADGTVIPLVEIKSAWAALEPADKAYCWYDNNPALGETYGALYTWAAAKNEGAGGAQGVCPDGWHLPDHGEWIQMEMHLGMSHSEAYSLGFRGTDEGGKLKEAGTEHWLSPNTGATNASGFTALPAGKRDYEGTFGYLYSNAFFWTATQYDIYDVWDRILYKDRAEIYCYYDTRKDIGFSVRCVKDE